jgi:hypothetical protein
VDVLTTDTEETLDATEPIFEVTSVMSGEALHTDAVIRVTSIQDNN